MSACVTLSDVDADVTHLPSPTTAEVALLKNTDIPPFTPRNVNRWFLCVESLFKSCLVTEEQMKYDVVITALGPDVAKTLPSFEANPSYSQLKKQILQKYTHDLIGELEEPNITEPIRDNPCKTLQNLKRHFPDDVALKKMFLCRLPSTVRLILADQSATATADELATAAEKIMKENDNCPTSVADVAPTPPIDTNQSLEPSSISRLDKLEAKLARMEMTLDRLTKALEGFVYGQIQDSDGSK